VNNKERGARRICAWCNFSVDCEECSHRDWPSGNYLISSQFNWKKCKEWTMYLDVVYRTTFQKIKDVCHKLGNYIKGLQLWLI